MTGKLTRREAWQSAILGTGALSAAVAPVSARSLRACAPGDENDFDAVLDVPAGMDSALKRQVMVEGGELPVWDSGGSGVPVVLVHATSGTAAAWQYQFDALRKAGWRVIAYSRRGTAEASAPGAGIETEINDLLAILDTLGLSKCHLVGTASGGMLVARLASRHGSRLASLTISCSVVAVDDSVCVRMLASLSSPEFLALPSILKELSPSYRATQPEGVKRWLEIEASSVSASIGRSGTSAARFGSAMARATALTPADLGAINVPVLLVYAEADLYSPPPLARRLMTFFRRCDLVVIAGAGHAAQWERPAQFNRALSSFLAGAGRKEKRT